MIYIDNPDCMKLDIEIRKRVREFWEMQKGTELQRLYAVAFLSLA